MLRITISDLDETITRLWDIFPKVNEQSTLSWEYKQKASILQQEIDEHGYMIDYDIRCALGDDGKPLYKNADARETAKQIKLSQDEGVQRRRKEIAELEELKQRADRLYWQYKDEFQALKSEIRVAVAVIEGLSDPVLKEVLCGRKRIDEI